MSNIVWSPGEGWHDGEEIDNAELLALFTESGKPVLLPTGEVAR